MSSSDTTHNTVETTTKLLFVNSKDSSEEPPVEEWSSLNFEIPEENLKRLLFDQDLYCPGSGEICTKYIPLSASSVLRHPYYKYPGITDPGIREALLLPEPKIVYPDDGQQLYLALCKEMGISPMRSFYRQLLEDIIDLKYYGIHTMGFRAIAVSLKNNRNVKVLNLTDNWIDVDGCYHIGQMLIENITLQELNLYGCKIGPKGARCLFTNMHFNRALRKLNLAKNCLGDTGVEYLSKAIFLGSDITVINLSYNDLTAKSLLLLAESFETHNKLTHLDLSWNKILSPNAVFNICSKLSENMAFEELNLSWNSLCGLRVGNAMRNLMRNPNLKSLYINNNKISTVEINSIAVGLLTSKNLNTLDLSYNPLKPDDALKLLLCLKDRKVKLRNLLLENILVTPEFIAEKNEILGLKYRKNTVVKWGGIIPKFISKSVDMREIVLNRAEALCKKSKKKPVDIALIILGIYNLSKEPMGLKEFSRELRSNGAMMDEDLVEEIVNSFPGPSSGKAKTINLSNLVDYLQRKWPDRQLPSPSPAEINPPPEAGKIKKK